MLKLRLWTIGAALTAVIVACSSSRSTTTSSIVASPLWGDIHATVSVKELMRDLIDPLADNVFESVKTVVSKDGVVETAPHTEEDWARVRIGGVALAEGAYLLKVPRPFAPAGEPYDPDSGELPPDQIEAKRKADPVLWDAKIEALRNVGLEVLDIVKRRDANELWDAGENLDRACENCHLEFWYPGQVELMKKLRQRQQSRISDTPPVFAENRFRNQSARRR